MKTFRIGISETFFPPTEYPYRVVVEEEDENGQCLYYHGSGHPRKETAESEATHVSRTITTLLTSAMHYKVTEAA